MKNVTGVKKSHMLFQSSMQIAPKHEKKLEARTEEVLINVNDDPNPEIPLYELQALNNVDY